MKILSLFWGLECWMMALKKIWIHIDEYLSSEVNKNPIACSSHNYKEIIHLWDVCSVHGIKNVDFLIWWPPCQDLSVAWKQIWLTWSRSGLFYEYVRILNEVKPKYFFLENVASMKDSAKDEITSQLFGIEPIYFDSGVLSPQRRKRLYWFWKRNDNGWYDTIEIDPYVWYSPTIFDILDNNKDPTSWKDLIECDLKFLSEHTKKSLIKNWICAWKILWRRLDENLVRHDYDKSIPITHRFEVNAIHDKTGTLTTFDKDNVLGFHIDWKFYYRKFTLSEYAKLQWIPGSYEFPIKKSWAYKAIWNGWQVDTIAYLFKQILKDDTFWL